MPRGLCGATSPSGTKRLSSARSLPTPQSISCFRRSSRWASCSPRYRRDPSTPGQRPEPTSSSPTVPASSSRTAARPPGGPSSGCASSREAAASPALTSRTAASAADHSRWRSNRARPVRQRSQSGRPSSRGSGVPAVRLARVVDLARGSGRRVLVGAFSIEANTFAPGATTLDDFRANVFGVGAGHAADHAGRALGRLPSSSTRRAWRSCPPSRRGAPRGSRSHSTASRRSSRWRPGPPTRRSTARTSCSTVPPSPMARTTQRAACSLPCASGCALTCRSRSHWTATRTSPTR